MPLADLIYATTLLFFIFDPFASLPIFITLTRSFSDEDKVKSANKAILVAGILFVIFVLVGKELLAAFSITTAGFRMAGGMVLMLMAIEIIFGITIMRQGGQNVAWVIVASPILTGPGVITTAIILTTNYGYVTPLFAGVISLVVTWGLLRNAATIVRFVGNNVIDIFSKVIGLFIAAMGIEYVMRGAIDYIVGSGLLILP
ncbi:MAG: MarC family protein [Methanomassiliicoccales archaeon]|nr:MarC family protein [Methanomassiliicoccales archaeon]